LAKFWWVRSENADLVAEGSSSCHRPAFSQVAECGMNRPASFSQSGQVFCSSIAALISAVN